MNDLPSGRDASPRTGFIRSVLQIATGTILGIGICALTALVVAITAFDSGRSAPELLKGLHAGSYIGCEPPAPRPGMTYEMPISELTARLRNKFRKTMPADMVEPYLLTQGFSRSKTCENDPNRKLSRYSKDGVTSAVAWTTDAEGGVEDVQGGITYD